jgi:hypothetical protein
VHSKVPCNAFSWSANAGVSVHEGLEIVPAGAAGCAGTRCRLDDMALQQTNMPFAYRTRTLAACAHIAMSH